MASGATKQDQKLQRGEGGWGGAGLQGALLGQSRPEVALCRKTVAREDSKVEMLALLIAMNPTAVSPTDKWTQGLSSALPTGGNWGSQGWFRLGLSLRERLSRPPIN